MPENHHRRQRGCQIHGAKKGSVWLYNNLAYFYLFCHFICSSHLICQSCKASAKCKTSSALCLQVRAGCLCEAYLGLFTLLNTQQPHHLRSQMPLCPLTPGCHCWVFLGCQLIFLLVLQHNPALPGTAPLQLYSLIATKYTYLLCLHQIPMQTQKALCKSFNYIITELHIPCAHSIAGERTQQTQKKITGGGYKPSHPTQRGIAVVTVLY